MRQDNELQERGLSVVIPAFNEEGNISTMYQELLKMLPGLDMPWEILFADDGSTDGTWKEVEALHAKDKRVKGVRLSRNFGHQYALFAGLSGASGDAVVSMDADLQHPPEVIPLLVSEWRKGRKIVNTVRKDSADSTLFKRVTSNAFYWLFSRASGIDLNPGMADFRLLDRQVVQQVVQFKEEGLFLRGIVSWVGYQQSCISFQANPRVGGTTKYTLNRMLKFAWHGISSFSIVPLRLGLLLGFCASLVSFCGTAYAIGGKLFTGGVVPGWTSSVAITSFLFGVLFLYLGVLAEYVGRIAVEVRQRPRYLVCECLGLDKNQAVTVKRADEPKAAQ